mgnify:CR=1 FL=1
METMLEEFGCYTDFIPLEEGLTRINVKVKSNEEVRSTDRDRLLQIQRLRHSIRNWIS